MDINRPARIVKKNENELMNDYHLRQVIKNLLQLAEEGF